MIAHPDGIRIYHPAQREAPNDLVRQLSAIDRRAALFYLRRGAWVLGTIVPDAERRGEAERALGMLSRAGKTMEKCRSRKLFDAAMEVMSNKVALWRLKLQGFVHHKTFDCRSVGDSELPGIATHWLQEAAWVRQHCYNATWNRLEHEMERDIETEQKESEVTNRARLRDAWRMEFKRPVSRTVGIDLKTPRFDANGVRVSA